jgi:lipopolysaccharide transport system permease protein
VNLESTLEAWRYRELVYFFAWRDVKVRYKQAVLGAAWAILQPLASMLVFAFFFGRLAKVPSDGVAYPLFAYTGLLLWTYFSTAITQAGQSLVSNSNLLTKVYFPRFTLPCSTVASGLLDFAIGWGFLAFLMVYYEARLSWTLVLVPLFTVQLILLTLGVGIWLAALNVLYRDIKHALPLAIQLWMFASPVIYPLDFIPERLRWLMLLNPLAGVVDGFRRCLLLGQLPDAPLTIASLVGTLLILVTGMAYFRKVERTLADVI